MFQNEKIKKIGSIFLIYVITFNHMSMYLLANSTIHRVSHDPNFFTTNISTDRHIEDIYNNEEKCIEEINKNENTQGVENIKRISLSSANSGNIGLLDLAEDMVDKFTGDLNYSLPLLDLEGFPITLNYDANISMEQEASWVGLGWNLDIGSVKRDLRGLPDDFNGDEIVREYKRLDTETPLGFNLGMLKIHKAGLDLNLISGGTIPVFLAYSWGRNRSFGLYANNKSGVGITSGLEKINRFGVSISLPYLFGINAGYGTTRKLTLDSQFGASITRGQNFNASLSLAVFPIGGISYGEQKAYNSRSGLANVSKNYSYQHFSIEDFLSNSTIGPQFGAPKSYTKTVGVITNRSIGHKSYISKQFLPSKSSSFSFNSSYTRTTDLIFYGITKGFSSEKFNLLNKITVDVVKNPAYGYNNYSKANTPNAMLDFNRPLNNGMNDKSNVLPFATINNDVFNCTSPLFNASFRSFRYDVVAYQDPNVISTAEGTGLDFSQDKLISIITGNTFTSSLSDRDENTLTTGVLKNQTIAKPKNQAINFDNKEYYYKAIGENTIFNDQFLSSFRDEVPVNIVAQLDNNIIKNSNILFDASQLPNIANVIFPFPQNYTNNNDVIQRKFEEIFLNGIENPELVTYAVNCDKVEKGSERSSFLDAKTENLQDSELKKSHHLIGANVYDVDGTKYIYDIPSYSYQEQEVSFSATNLIENAYHNLTGLIRYDYGDNSSLNARGRDQLFDKLITPAYANEFLLSKILSSDYIDRLNDGLTSDDIGNYYKINYDHPYGENNTFNWRFPICSNIESTDFDENSRLAFASKNIHSDKFDDIAYYKYGKKDLFYTSTIESKNFILYFCLDDRKDQFSIIDEDGGLDYSKPGKHLKSIYLYSKNELNSNKPQVGPLKRIDFIYDYSLCREYVGNINSYGSSENENSGKLTLKKILIYNYKTGENKTIPIEFEYSQINPDFAYNSSDRWGNYKANNPTYPNFENPASVQDEQTANTNIQAWKLTKVKQESGISLEFEYEADRYSHVENRRVMKLNDILGMSTLDKKNELANSSNQYHPSTLINDLPNGDKYANGISFIPNNVVYFALEEPITTSDQSTASEELKKQYFSNSNGELINTLYFNMYSQVGANPNNKEFIESNIDIKKDGNGEIMVGVIGSAPYFVGYVVLQNKNFDFQVNQSDLNIINDFYNSNMQKLPLSFACNPLLVESWEFAMKNIPCAMYGTIDQSAGNATQFCDYNNVGDFNVTFGINMYYIFSLLKYNLSFDIPKSKIRLNDPNNEKFGGNSRVKKIIVKNSWNQLSGETDEEYSVRFTYGTINNSINEHGNSNFEPLLGKIENPLYNLKKLEKYGRPFLDSTSDYELEPFDELIYANPVVGYSVVNMQTNKSGGLEYRYLTSKDRPQKRKYTRNVKQISGDVDQTGFFNMNGNNFEYTGFSQGFVVISNDIHGKILSISKKDQIGSTIESVSYSYFDPSSDKLKFIEKDGSVIESKSNREVDIYLDSWKTFTDVNTLISTNTLYDRNLLGIIPMDSEDNSNFTEKYTHDVTGLSLIKVIHEYYQLSSINKTSFGSNVNLKFLAFDKYSGEPIVTSKNNEFNDLQYEVNYPAHWKYENLGNVAQNLGAYFKPGTISSSGNGIVYNVTNNATLKIGDQVLITNLDLTTQKAWVNNISSNVIYLVDENGVLISNSNWPGASIKVIKSGFKNRLNETMMSYITTKNPLQTNNLNFNENHIISISAVKYKENNFLPCFKSYDAGSSDALNYAHIQFSPGNIINPFLKGTKGNLYPYSDYIYQDTRRYYNQLPNIREVGLLEELVTPFYDYSAGKWYSLDEVGHPNYQNGALGKWRLSNMVNQYDEYGKVLQVENQLKQNSSVLYGMNKDLKLIPKASAQNAKANEIGFDGFEDYNFYQNNPLKYLNFGFTMVGSVMSPGSLVQISDKHMHSGYHSLEIHDFARFKFPVSIANPSETNHFNTLNEYEVQACDCIKDFSQERGKTYLFSFWAKKETKIYPYDGLFARVIFLDALGNEIGQSRSCSTSGPVVDGWQKLECSYSIPAVAYSMFYEISSNAHDIFYLDDFRTHPSLSEMTTVVYDQYTMLPMAEQDINNYCTFYHYDEGHNLVRKRIETVDGIQTIEEIGVSNKRK